MEDDPGNDDYGDNDVETWMYTCTTYQVENTGCDIEKVVATVVNTTNEEKVVNDRIRERLHGIFSSVCGHTLR